MNALLAAMFDTHATGMGQDAAIFLEAVLASIEWLADRRLFAIPRDRLRARLANCVDEAG